MAPPPKGKAPTRGAKQIFTENRATVNFYRNISLVTSLIYHSTTLALHFRDITSGTILLNLIVSILYIGSHQVMYFLSYPQYAENGQMIDPGLDLNMEGGIGEHIKDIVILTAITHLLTLFSDYFWLLLLLLPARIFWLVWVNFLGPWFFEKAPEDTEQDEKKRKKMERKMKRFPQ
ncbi:transmembrane protein 208 [Vanessa tameamea]|uniref:Transmembrane protein 208 n=1 Tax=Vanessa tameamea TaxID=334116 RepID=A0A8B8IUF5_VANTA|nr:transmembrane protein 208 [Vanessa tameamea]